MFNFGASKPRVKGEGPGPRAPPGSAPEHGVGYATKIASKVLETFFKYFSPVVYWTMMYH